MRCLYDDHPKDEKQNCLLLPDHQDILQMELILDHSQKIDVIPEFCRLPISNFDDVATFNKEIIVQDGDKGQEYH